MSLEQEIKLKVPGEQAPELAALDWLNALTVSRGTYHLRTDYYDSPDLMLKQAGLALRLRQLDTQWFQTVKSQGRVEQGLHQREEWESPIADGQFDLALLRQTPLQPFVDDAGRWQQLNLLFTTEFDRQVWQLVSGSTQIELAYDRGEVRTTQQHAAIHEIELELLQGDVTVLRALAERLKTDLRLSYHAESKAATGYRLLQQR